MAERGDSGLPTTPLPLDQCGMTLAGVNALVQHLQSHPTFANVDVGRLRAMAIAYLTFGGTTDNRHNVPLGNLHPAHHAVHTPSSPWRISLRTHFMSLVTDMLTWLDRLSGGSTFMVHSSGTRPPHTNAVPEEARLDVFLPIILLNEFPDLRPIFAQLVQSYAQHVATVTMERWDHAKGLNVGGALHQANVPRLPSGRQRRTVLIPEGSTPYRIFHGRPAGELERLLTQHLEETSSPSSNVANTGRLPTTSSGPSPARPSSSMTTTRTPTRSSRSASDSQYISPPGMPHIKLQYHLDDPWTKTDLIEFTKMMEGSSGNVPSTGLASDSADVNEKLRSIIGTYEEDIERLQGMVRSQEAEIARLKQLLNRDAAESGSPATSKRTTSTSTQNPGTLGAGKGKGRAQPRASLPSPSLSSVPSPSSLPLTTRSGAGGRSESPSTPTPSRLEVNRPHPRSRPNMPVGTSASRSIRQSGGASVRGDAILGPHDQRPSGVGLHARQAVLAHGYSFSLFPVIASVQQELAPEDWSDALLQRIDGSTPEFVSALVDSMRKDCRLPLLRR